MTVHLGSDELIARFTWVDYTVFCLMLALSAGIGVFYGCFGPKMKDTKDFLMAGKEMTTFPVAMSLIASFMSAIALLGTPSEVYQNGLAYSLIVVSYIAVMISSAYLYLPVFWDLQVTSAYEYLERRFNKGLRVLGSILFIAQMVFYMAIVVYAPALALAQVTGLHVHISVSLICFVCIFYTTLGGMKAVLWTDALQTIVMYGSTLFIVVQGTIDVGGFQKVWEIGTKGNRTQIFDWDTDLRTRHSVWSLVIGGYFVWIAIYGVNQAQVQRYLCVKTKQMAIRALWINCIGFVVLILCCSFGGLVVYAKYAECDPVSSKVVSKADQMLPYFVMDALGHWKGLPGLFVAGIFSGALSTISSGMNSLAAITLEDIVRLGFPNLSEKAATIISKLLSLFYGVLTFVLVFVAEKMGDIVSAALGIYGLIGGPLLGVFTLGMFVPWANSFGASVGTVLGLTITLWIGIGYQVASRTGAIIVKRLPVNTCGNYSDILFQDDDLFSHENATAYFEALPLAQEIETYENPIIEVYKISYMWYSAIGCISVLIFGIILSFLSGKNNISKMNPRLISPLIHWMGCLFPSIANIGSNYVGDELTFNKVESGGTIINVSLASNDDDYPELNIKQETKIHVKMQNTEAATSNSPSELKTKV